MSYLEKARVSKDASEEEEDKAADGDPGSPLGRQLRAWGGKALRGGDDVLGRGRKATKRDGN